MTLLCATSFPCGANSPGASVSRRPHHWADNSAQRHSLERLQRGGQALIGQAEQLTLGHHFLQRLHGSFLLPRSTPLPTVPSWVTCWPCSISPISAMLCPLSPRRPSPDHPPSCPRFCKQHQFPQFLVPVRPLSSPCRCQIYPTAPLLSGSSDHAQEAGCGWMAEFSSGSQLSFPALALSDGHRVFSSPHCLQSAYWPHIPVFGFVSWYHTFLVLCFVLLP